MATDAFMAFKNFGVRDGGGYLKSESTVVWSNSSEPLAQPFNAAGVGNIFEVSEYSFDLTQTLNITSQSTGAGSGKIEFGDFSITRAIDVSSTSMFQNCCAATPFEFVYLGLRKGSGGNAGGDLNVSGQFYLLFRFAVVAVKSINYTHADPSPTETIVFNFGAMQVQYAQQAATGILDAPKSAAWNILKGSNDFPT